MKKIRYNLISALKDNIDKHPQIDLIDLGYKVITYEPIPMGDCILCEVENIILPLPNYIEIVKNDN